MVPAFEADSGIAGSRERVRFRIIHVRRYYADLSNTKLDGRFLGGSMIELWEFLSNLWRDGAGRPMRALLHWFVLAMVVFLGLAIAEAALDIELGSSRYVIFGAITAIWGVWRFRRRERHRPGGQK